jgi:membrane protein
MADTSASGRQAEKPTQFGGKAWRDVGKRTAGEVKKDRLSMVAAGVAFYAFLALFPAIAAMVSIYGMVANPADIQQAVEGMRGVLPSEVVNIVSQQMSSIAGSSGAALGLGAAISILLAIWSANKGTKALMEALNIAYGEREARGFLRLNGVALLLTIGGIIGLILAAAMVVALPAIIGMIGLPETLSNVLQWGRWPVLAIVVIAGLAILYRYGPSRAAPRFQWVSIGAVAATVLWLLASGLFSFYVANFGSYNETYGSIAAIVILLLWFYISAFVILIGAEMNAEMEHQTERDTTTGEPVPMGARQAAMADSAAGEAGKERGAGAPPGRRAPPAGEEKPRAAAPARGTAEAARSPEMSALEEDAHRARAALGATLGDLGARLTPRSAADTVLGKVHATREAGVSGRGTYDYLRQQRPLLMGALGIAVGAALARNAERKAPPPTRGAGVPPPP